MKTLGQLREEIDSNPTIKKLGEALERQGIPKIDELFDEVFPSASEQVVSEQQLQTLAVLCGNIISKAGNNNAVVSLIGGQVSSEILRVMGFQKLADSIDDC